MPRGEVKNYKNYPNPSLVISVDEASKLLKKSGKEKVVFIDTRNYWKYVKGHIPGAYNFELYAFHWVDTSEQGLDAFVMQTQMLLRSFGINKQNQVVFYQNNSGYDAARGVWLLNYLGHMKAKLLDGGLNLWKRKRLPLSIKDPEMPKPSNFLARKDKSLIATLDSLSSRLGSASLGGRKRNGSLQVIDTRDPGEYDGTYHRAQKAGHIPTSINIEWKRALRKDGTLKSAHELRKLYSNVSNTSETVTYCQSGYRAAHSWLVLRLLGFPKVKNYLGSWYEWGNNPKTRVVRD